MALTLRKTVFHMRSQTCGAIDVKLTYNGKEVTASAEYMDQAIFTMQIPPEYLAGRTDWDIIRMGLNNLQNGHENWLDIGKCRVLLPHVSSFELQSKDSIYSLMENGVSFNLKVSVDMLTDEYQIQLSNSVNSDVLFFKANSGSEVEITDNVLVYAAAMKQIALLFKQDQTRFMQKNEDIAQHKFMVGSE